MRYLLALSPILVVLVLMTGWRWGAHKAGAGGWLAALTIAAVSFGLTPQVFWVSQFKGLLLSAFVLAVMWPALFLFHWLNVGGGIEAIARALERAIPDRGMCALMMAWALSGLLEGMAGFGLPVAIVSPMVVAVGVPPLRAVAAVAIGHCWAVSFGSMGLIFQTLAVITGIAASDLAPWAALLLGAACLGCGLGAARVLGQQKHWPEILAISVLMGGGQYALAATDLIPLACFGAGAAGLGGYVLLGQIFGRSKPNTEPSAGRACSPSAPSVDQGKSSLWPALASYGALALIMGGLTLYSPLRKAVENVAWEARFEQVTTRTGCTTPAGSGPVFRLFTHPGTAITLVAVMAVAFGFARPPVSSALPPRVPSYPNILEENEASRLRQAGLATWQSGALTTIGIVSMVGISTLMEHCGMSLLLAKGAGQLLASAYPLASPLVGVLGAFATGSNNNSNIMFGPLQKNVAILLHISPALLVAAQTAGGSLGSLLAPAKLVVGCSTVGLAGQEGLVLRQTLPYGIAIGLGLGLLTLICASVGG